MITRTSDYNDIMALGLGGAKDYQEFVDTMFADELKDITSFKPVKTDYKSSFQVVCQKRQAVLPQYQIVKTEGPDHDRVFTCEVYVADELAGIGTGKSKKEAEAAAAKAALEAMPESGGADEE